MSFQFNSDREQIRGVDSTIIGSGSVRIRSGSGIEEREIFQAKVDATSGLPRVGINRTGRRVDSINVLTAGSGYSSQPSVNIAPPTLVGGIQAIASASTDNFGRITGIQIDNPGDGYEFPPQILIEGGGGQGGTAQAFLDTIDFELDVNGAIRTSTSIISDTANILNLDINNLVTPDLKVRGPDLKTWANGSGTRFPTNVEVNKDAYYFEGNNVYQMLNSGVTDILPPFHTDGVELNGEVQVKHIGYRVDSPALPFYGETGESGLFPRSITPLLGDRSTKIATTEYVLNLATNDVGGRIYVSEQIGNDNNDGRSPVNPVRTIKRACQLAWETPGVKESIIIAGGNYIEDNPISIPPDASIVGDNLRLVIIRPANTGKHIFKFGDKNYVIGVTYQDQVNSSGASVGTWDFAMVFDDKQRITYDIAANGDFGIEFPVGHQFFGNESFQANFSSNLTGLDQLSAGIEIFGVNSGGVGVIGEVVFDETDPAADDTYETGQLKNIVRTSGNTFNNSESFFYGGTGTTKWQPETDYDLGDIVWTNAVLGDQSLTGYVYTVTQAGTSGTTNPDHGAGAALNGTVEFTFLRGVYIFTGSQVSSTTPEGEVVFTSKEYQTSDDLPIQLVDFSLQGTFNDGFQSEIYGSAEDLGGIVFYTNQLDGAANIHDFKEGEEIEITGMPTVSPDLSFLNGKHRIYKVIEDADGRSRRFVLPKKVPDSIISDEPQNNPWDPAIAAATPSVRTFSKSVTMTLLNTPNKFPVATPVARRYQDACSQIRNNIDFIADEVVRKINDQFKQEYFFAYDIGAGGGFDFKIYLGTSRFAHTYVSGGTVTAGGNTYNVTNFVYDHNVTGTATITIDSAPAFAEDDTILLADLTVSCIIDGVVTQKVYPSFNIPVSDAKCRRDVGHFLNALIQDLEFGSNYNTINAARRYFSAGQIEYIDYEIIQTVRAIEYARELAIYAMRKWRTGTGLAGEPVYVPQYSTIDLYIDPTVIDDVAATACANVASAINTLSYLFVDIIANDSSGTYLDAAYLIARNRHFIADEAYLITKSQYPALGLNNVDERKCRRDINYIISGVLRDLVLGGNTGSVNAAEFYFTGTALTGVPASELGPTRYAFEKVRDLSILAMRNWYTNGGAGAVYTPLQSTIPLFTDSSILTDPAGTPWCAAVESSLTTSFGLIDGILEYAADDTSPTAIQPGSTTRTTGTLYTGDNVISYPANVLRDSEGNYVTIRAVADDFPIISASPYTQNASIISKAGGSGALIDGSKVKSPNCPFPGLTDGKATYPNQGKSMVASAFTIVSERNGTGYKIIEDGYVQLVSVFCIFTVDGILAESGGYASVTNSASNFGTFALRATGYRKEAYSFDAGYDSDNGYVRARIDAVTTAVSGLTELTIENLGRAPLEHYIIKIDGYETRDSDLEYFINDVELINDGVPYIARVTVTDGTGGSEIDLNDSTTGLPVAPSVLTGKNIALHRPSIVNSSSHTFEFVGSGTTYEALPENGGIKRGNQEQVSENYGRVYASGTDELGDFKVGDFVIIENRTGNIQFKGTVSISEVDFLKLSGGDVTITGFSKLATLGGDDANDQTLPTQKAVRDFVVNNLGQYIGKGFTTNRVPRNLVELNDQGLISESQLPTTSPIEVYSVANETEQLALEGVRAGDIAVVDGEAFILNTDSDSLFLGIAVDTSLQFTVNDIFTGSITGGKIQLTEYRPGVIKNIIIPEGGGGAGYSTSNPPTVVITDDGVGTGHIPAVAQAIVAGGEVVAINLVLSNSVVGGQGYIGVPTISFTNTSGGAGAQATAEIESRLYGDIVNSIKIGPNDFIQSSDVPSETVDVIRVVNTSASNPDNWVSLNTGTISADAIVDGPIPTDILANNSQSANSDSFLAGDQSYKKVVKSFRNIETRYFLRTATASASDTILFEVNSENDTNALIVGHSLATATGIQPGTTIDQITSVTVGTTNYVRITLSDGLTSEIPAGTIIQFNRPESPVRVTSLLRTIGAVDKVLIINGGTGFASDYDGNRVFGNIEVTGGSEGTGLRLDITVVGGVVTNVAIANPGTGFDGDFTIDTPSEIGTGGSGLILQAKVQQKEKLEGDITIDVARATSDTLSGDDYGTVGVARFRKSQFTIGDNGSVLLNTGTQSGLDADLLDGFQGSDYRNASKIASGVLGRPYLEGTYDINITKESGSTASLTAKSGTLNDDETPGEIDAGGSLVVRRNDTDNLLDPPTKPNPAGEGTVSTASDYHVILSIRGGGVDNTNQFGGVTQLAFTDGNNMYIRGSSGSVASDQNWSTWGKIWSSQNDYTTDPANTAIEAGPNAYRLRNRTGLWYQNANSFTFGDLSDRRLPSYFTQKDINTRLRILEDTGTGKRYDIYIQEVTASIINAFDNSPFTDTPRDVKLLTASGDDPGVIRVNNITVYNIQGEEVDTSNLQNINDYSALYAIVTGTMSAGGNFIFTDAQGNSFPAEFLGDDTVQIRFHDYSLSDYDGDNDGMPDGNVEAIRLESVGGESFLIMGREDGQQGSDTTPQIWFRSSATVPTNTTLWYNSGFKASGGNDNNGSGTLDVLVTSPNAFTVGGNTVWNAGNTLITATNTGSTYNTTGGNSQFDENNPDSNVSLRSLVMRDEDGNFAANVISADLDGTATGNLPIDGGVLTGGLQIGDSNNDASFVVYGPTTLNGNLSVVDSGQFVVGTNAFVADPTDGVGIGTTPDYKLDLYQRTNTSGTANGTTLFRLTNDVRNFADPAAGDLSQQKTFIDFTFVDSNTNFTPQVRIGAEVGENGDADNTTKEGSGAFVVYTATGTGASSGTLSEKLRVAYDGNVGINVTDPTSKLHVDGQIRTQTTLLADEGITIGENTGAPLIFNGGPTDTTTGGKNFRLGNNLSLGVDIFEISTSVDNGGTTSWTTAQSDPDPNAPALAIKGSTNAVAINTTAFSGIDSSDANNLITRNYQLNVQGDVNFNGQLFQDNEPFVTSRWTEASSNIVNSLLPDIYRLSAVGINTDTPQVTFDVRGAASINKDEKISSASFTDATEWNNTPAGNVTRTGARSFTTTSGASGLYTDPILRDGIQYKLRIVITSFTGTTSALEIRNGAGTGSAPLLLSIPAGSTGLFEDTFTTSGNEFASIYFRSLDGSIDVTFAEISIVPTTGDGSLRANGDRQWIDSYGVFKANRNTISESLVVPQNTNCMTAGPVTINNNVIIEIADGASWSIV